MMRRHLRSVFLVAASALALAACGASPTRFSDAAEKFIQGEEVAAWGEQSAFVNAVCTEPDSVTVNTEFQCTADGSDSHSYIFQIVITGERKFRVESLQPQS